MTYKVKFVLQGVACETRIVESQEKAKALRDLVNRSEGVVKTEVVPA